MGLSQVLFPVVLLLGLTGLLVGILQSYEHFTIPALAPAVWNVVIVVVLVLLRPDFHGSEQLYAYAIGILIATGVQFAMALGALARIDFRLQFSIDWHDPRIRQVFVLMLPVTIGLGIVNLDQFINASFGTLVSEQAPRAIENAFRVYMLPQGIFSVAVATVLFPTLSRMAARRDPGGMRRAVGNGMRQINLLLIPAAAFMIVLAHADRATALRTRELQPRIDRTGLDRPVLVCVLTALRGLEPVAHAHLLRGPASLDPDESRRAEHDRRHHRLALALQAPGDRGADHRHPRG